jgi:hypothetical protein
VGERGFNAVQVSQRTQKIVAIVCGILLLCVIALILINNSSSHKSSDDSASKTQTQSAVNTEKSTADTTTKPAEETQPKVTDEAENDAKTDTKTHPTSQAASDNKSSTKDQYSEKSYVFTAIPGDSFTALAYDAVGQYAAVNKINLTVGQRTQAAATLAANAGSPLLEIGQVVNIEKSDIAALVGAQAPSAPQSQEPKPSAPADKNQTTKEVANYSFTAVSGDSYITLARRAVSDHAASAKLNLTPAQRIAAETSITTAAGFPGINIGQVVTFTHVSIKDAVEAAQDLSVDQLSNWQPYANLVSF